jgi:acetolactate synthase I/II/III large subunit
MTGAEILMKTAAHAGIDVCFANFGTTELHLVHALDAEPNIRPVAGLFEGVCTGAADGYGRMRDKPAMTLLHLGLGLSNGLANLHNARRAGTPIFNVVGEHATWHRLSDAPEIMDLERLAGSVSDWMRTSASVDAVAGDVLEAVGAAMTGKIATLMVPQDCQWAERSDGSILVPMGKMEQVDKEAVEHAARILRSDAKAVLLLGSRALRSRGLHAAQRISAATGCDVVSEVLPARMDRGLGLPFIARMPYFPEDAAAFLSGYQVVIAVGTSEPVAFFAYQGGRSRLLTDEHQFYPLGQGSRDLEKVLESLAAALGAPPEVDVAAPPDGHSERSSLPTGPLDAEKACRVLAAIQPEGAIIVDESVTSGGAYYPLAATAPPHSWLTLTGGAIGFGMPAATGAAIACPDRPVINFQADGSALYTVQALWTQARESLNVTTLICSNRSYGILRFEMVRAGQVPLGPASMRLTDIGTPPLDWVQLSRGFGVPAVSVATAEEMASALTRALAEPGPHLIELMLYGN